MISLEPLDLANPADAERWVAAAIERWGQIDVLYNNAAGIARAPFEEATVDHWNYTLRNELTLGYVAARAAWPHFVRQGRGVIVSVASVAGHIELAGLPFVAHGVANAGVQAMARMFASEGAPHGIRSVSISPGIVANPYQPEPYGNPASPEMTALWGPTPLGRPAEDGGGRQHRPVPRLGRRVVHHRHGRAGRRRDVQRPLAARGVAPPMRARAGHPAARA